MWLHNPCRLGGPHRFTTGGRITGGPQAGKEATWPLPLGGSPPLQRRGAESEVAHKWARWLHNPCRLGGPDPLGSGGAESQVAHKWARWLHNPCGLGVPTASDRGAESEVAHKWARWLHNPCRLGGANRFRVGGRITGGPQAGKEATWPLPLGGSPPLQRRGAESEVAHKWARWLHNPCRLGGPQDFRAGGRKRSGPKFGKVATQTLPPRGSPPLQRGGQNQRWPTRGQGGYMTRLGRPHRFRVGGRIRSGPQVGKVAT